MTRMTGPDCAVICNSINTHTHTHTHTHTQVIDPPWEDQREWHRMTRMTRPDCAVMCNLINTHTHTHTRYVDLWSGWLRRSHQGARHQTGRAQVGDTLQRVPISSGRDGSSTSSAAILFCFTAGTFIPHASPSLLTEGGACEHPTAPSVHANRPEGVTGSEGREGANGVKGRIVVGAGSRDGNGVAGGNEDVNGHGDGDGTGTGTETGVEVSEGAQDGNGDRSGGGGP